LNTALCRTVPFFSTFFGLERQEFMARLSMRKVLRLWNFKKQEGNDWKMSLETARRGICKEKILPRYVGLRRKNGRLTASLLKASYTSPASLPSRRRYQPFLVRRATRVEPWTVIPSIHPPCSFVCRTDAVTVFITIRRAMAGREEK